MTEPSSSPTPSSEAPNQPRPAGELPTEETEVHTKIVSFGLGCEEARSYWRRVDDPRADRTAMNAFRGQWFGQASENRCKRIMRNMRARYDAYPDALRVLSTWEPRDLEIRTVICHWHTQLADPLYRRFTGEYLEERRQTIGPEVDRSQVARWVAEQQPGRWKDATHREFASKLLSVAYKSGLVDSTRDPRPLVYPHVPDDALFYILHLLREVDFAGTLLDNPYLGSVGLTERFLEDRVRSLDGVELRRMGDLTEFDSRVDSLSDWAEEFAA